MKKILTLTLSLLAVVALVVAPVTSFAGACGSKAKTTSADAKAHCSGKDAKACAAKLGLSEEECKKLCAVEGHEMVSLSIEGMTCGSCENSITTALQEIDGVMKVGKVSHKEGSAFVVINSAEVKASELAKVVTKKGYKAEVVLAHAGDAGAQSKMVSATAAGCGTMTKKACSKSCAKTCGAKAKTDKADKTDKTDKTEGTN